MVPRKDGSGCWASDRQDRYAGRVWWQGLLLALGLFGCSYSLTGTRRVAVLGYAKPPRIVVVTRGPADLVTPWAADLRAAGTVEIVNELPAPDAQPPAAQPQTEPAPTNDAQPPAALVKPDTAVCQIATDLATAGTPVDEILTVTANETSEPHYQCIKTECTTGDLVGQGTSGEPQCDCVQHRYEGTTARASVHLRVVRAATCQLLRTFTAETPNRTVTSDPQSDVELAHRLVAELLAAAAVRDTPDLFPNGNAVLGVQGRSIEIRNDRDPLAPGATYWLHDPHARGPRLRVVRADSRSATLQADLEPDGVEPGDELHVTRYVVRQTVYGAVTGGRAVTHEGAYGQAGAAVTARWSFDRYPIVAELGLTGDLLPRLDTARLAAGIAAGVRWPFGPVHPIGFGELGLGKAYQGDNRQSRGGYLGAGAGIEVWFAGLFVFADVRWRRFWMQGWQDVANAPVVVKHPDLDTRAITGQVAIGRVF